ncbi:MAG: hypothetical protein FJ404_00350 [Verrucomicrobia bacterium]|nr:hypothetical protein [Verrucomicrobiota bacterium]
MDPLPSHAAETAPAPASSEPLPKEEDFYRIVTLPIPPGITLEAGAMAFLQNGQLAVSTRRGEIYRVNGAMQEDPGKMKFHLFASGLHEVLGLAEKDGWLYCAQRGEITRIKDLDQDGRADRFETVSDNWGLTGDYHEYAFGSKFDTEGYLWVVLCLTGSFTSDAPFRGWCLRVAPDGKTIPTASGLRSPGGIGANHLGEMFYTENQGPWNGACTLKHLVPGDFMGHPSGNTWYSLAPEMGPKPPTPASGGRLHLEAEKNPRLRPPAVYFPYPKKGQSASGIACDTTGGGFGPFTNQLFVADQAHSTVMRVSLEKVNEVTQGACFMMRQGFDSGNLALEFAPDHSLMVYGTDRGWGARGGKPFALQRLVWNQKTPFEIRQMLAKPDGFELVFTTSVQTATASNPADFQLKTYTYIYQSRYGSPEVDPTRLKVLSATPSPDDLRVRLKTNKLMAGHVHELKITGLRSANGLPLLHGEAYYTMNQIPKVTN